jgi:hypothetical protein
MRRTQLSPIHSLLLPIEQIVERYGCSQAKYAMLSWAFKKRGTRS